MHYLKKILKAFTLEPRIASVLRAVRASLQVKLSMLVKETLHTMSRIHEISEVTNRLIHTWTDMQNMSIDIIRALNEFNTEQFLDYFQFAITF